MSDKPIDHWMSSWEPEASADAMEVWRELGKAHGAAWLKAVADKNTKDFAAEEAADHAAALIIRQYGDQRYWRGVEDAAKSKAGSDVLAERQRQIEVEGWLPEHDDEHSAGEMSAAAATYALGAAFPDKAKLWLMRYWPWAPAWWKPKGTRPNLVRAGALILAEIERLDRLALLETQEAE